VPAQPESAARLAASPSPSLARAWKRATRTTDPMVLTGAAVTVAVVAIVVIVIATKGGANHPSGVATASTIPAEATPTESTPTESTPTESTATTATVESPRVEQVLSEYRQDYSNEDVESLKGLFAESLERRDGNKAPEGLGAALATYKGQFGELKKPVYSLSGTSIEPGAGEASASAQYSIGSQNGTVTGSITFHLVQQGEKLLIDKLTIEPSK
jgi:hypothetical protein